MIQQSARRFVFSLVLGVSTMSLAALAHAQTTAPKGGTTPNGVTGTDPCPKNYICTISGVTPSPTSSNTAAGTPSSTGTVMQAVLAWLGVS